jgi:dTDP-glucose pyrophosphorylase
VENGGLKYGHIKGDGFIPCFIAEGDHWSFVRLDETGKVVEIKEKERISDYCTIGAYYFKSCELYEKLYQEYYSSEQNLVNGEKYVAPLYNYLLTKNGEIYISCVEYDKVHVLGTPKELAEFVRCDLG